MAFCGERFGELAAYVGEDLALFYCCISSDTPYITDVVREMEQPDFYTYKRNIEENGYTICGTEQVGFLDGVTDVRTVLEGSRDERSRQRDQWGYGDPENPYTRDDYQRLDELFRTYTARLVSAGGYDEQQEDTLRSCCEMRLLAGKKLATGTKDGIDAAAKLNKMIQENLASESLRRKDEKPVEELRIDSIVDAMEKAGLMRSGKILDLPDLQEQLLRRLGALGGSPSHKYPYTLDAADQMILSIRNCMAGNNGLPEITELPDNLRLDSNVSCEFAAEPNDTEIETYEEMGIPIIGSVGKRRGK